MQTPERVSLAPLPEPVIQESSRIRCYLLWIIYPPATYVTETSSPQTSSTICRRTTTYSNWPTSASPTTRTGRRRTVELEFLRSLNPHPDHGQGIYRQSPKMDVWSLVVSIVSLMVDSKFHETELATSRYSETLGFVRDTVPKITPELKAVAHENPELRASAAQILVLHFNGKGLTTWQSEIGLIPEVSESPTAGARAQANVTPHHAALTLNQATRSPRHLPALESPAYGSIEHSPNVLESRVPSPSTGELNAPRATAWEAKQAPPPEPGLRPPPPVAGPSVLEEVGLTNSAATLGCSFESNKSQNSWGGEDVSDEPGWLAISKSQTWPIYTLLLET